MSTAASLIGLQVEASTTASRSLSGVPGLFSRLLLWTLSLAM